MDMPGLRIRTRVSLQTGAMDYSLGDILDPIAPDIAALSWYLEPLDLHVPQDWSGRVDNALSALTLESSDDGQARVLKPAFISTLAPFIRGDWTVLAGLAEPLPLFELRTLMSDLDKLAEQVTVFFSCLEGRLWEVYAHDRAMLQKLRDQFPRSASCSFRQKRFT